MTLRRLCPVTVTCLSLLLGAAPAGRSPARASGPAQASPIFRFDADNATLALHGFLYVLGRHANEAPDRTRAAVSDAPGDEARGFAGLDAGAARAWREAVAAYAAGLSRLDAVFDEGHVQVTGALARGSGQPLDRIADLPGDVRGILQRVAPIYERVWWPAHQRANREWVAAMAPLVVSHGSDVLAFITRAYGTRWPAGGYPVNVVPYSNWAGAYSTTGNLLLVASLSPNNAGSAGLEITFHEAMHQWDEEVGRALAAAAAPTGATVPGQLSHAMIFYTAGEAVRRAIPGHVPYAEANGIWARGMGAFKPALDTAWRPWLDGTGSRQQALAELVSGAGLPPW